MWFHLWLLFNGCESVSDLSWLFIQQELLLFALPHNLTVVKMIFAPQTAANVPIPLHSCLQKVYRGKAGVTFSFYMKILFIICVHDDFIKPSFQHFDNFLLEENCQIPYQFFFSVMFLTYNSLWNPSTPQYSGNTWMDDFLLPTRLCSIRVFLVHNIHGVRLHVNFQIRCIRKTGCFLQF